MKKILGIIHFISLIGGIFLCLSIIISEYSRLEEYENLLDSKPVTPAILFILPLSIGVVYVVVTKFGASKSKLFESLDEENEIIKKQIEKRELLTRLESLEKKSS